jgi:hypothetical protein
MFGWDILSQNSFQFCTGSDDVETDPIVSGNPAGRLAMLNRANEDGMIDIQEMVLGFDFSLLL